MNKNSKTVSQRKKAKDSVDGIQNLSSDKSDFLFNNFTASTTSPRKKKQTPNTKTKIQAFVPNYLKEDEVVNLRINSSKT